jgi:hypothetical protein
LLKPISDPSHELENLAELVHEIFQPLIDQLAPTRPNTPIPPTRIIIDWNSPLITQAFLHNRQLLRVIETIRHLLLLRRTPDRIRRLHYLIHRLHRLIDPEQTFQRANIDFRIRIGPAIRFIR